MKKWKSNLLIVLGSLSALFGLLSIYVTFFVYGNGGLLDDSSVNWNRMRMRLVVAKLNEYKKICGAYPEPVGDLSKMLPGNISNCDESRLPPDFFYKDLMFDEWRTEFVYRNNNGILQLGSYRRDKVAGGSGDEADVFIEVKDD